MPTKQKIYSYFLCMYNTLSMNIQEILIKYTREKHINKLKGETS